MKDDVKMSPEEVAIARERRLEAMRLQEIEGNPFTPEDIAMFDRFDREGWSQERRRAFIIKEAKSGGV